MATYTIGEVAKRTGMSPYTLRFYDRQGILPFVERDAVGNRAFKESDFEWLRVINCLKKTGMPIKKIKQYVIWCMEGDTTLDIRLEVMKQHKEDIQAKMTELEQFMEMIDHKIDHYEGQLQAVDKTQAQTPKALKGVKETVAR